MKNKKSLTRMVSVLLIVLMLAAVFPAAHADEVTYWERIDTGEVIPMTEYPSDEELENLQLHVHTFDDWDFVSYVGCNEPFPATESAASAALRKNRNSSRRRMTSCGCLPLRKPPVTQPATATSAALSAAIRKA